MAVLCISVYARFVCNMSRKSRFEYIGEKRRAYAKSGKAKRSRILDEVCETLGYTRKYVIKLLTGNIRYRERKGRGRTYGTSALENVRRIWESVGCPCTTYFVAELPRIMREYEECIAIIKPKEDKTAILSMTNWGQSPPGHFQGGLRSSAKCEMGTCLIEF